MKSFIIETLIFDYLCSKQVYNTNDLLNELKYNDKLELITFVILKNYPKNLVKEVNYRIAFNYKPSLIHQV